MNFGGACRSSSSTQYLIAYHISKTSRQTWYLNKIIPNKPHRLWKTVSCSPSDLFHGKYIVLCYQCHCNIPLNGLTVWTPPGPLSISRTWSDFIFFTPMPQVTIRIYCRGKLGRLEMIENQGGNQSLFHSYYVRYNRTPRSWEDFSLEDLIRSPTLSKCQGNPSRVITEYPQSYGINI